MMVLTNLSNLRSCYAKLFQYSFLMMHVTRDVERCRATRASEARYYLTIVTRHSCLASPR